MTTAHRPTWKAAVGRAQEGGWSAGGAISTAKSVLDEPSHTKLKFRGDTTTADKTDREEILRQSLAKLEQVEQQAQAKRRIGKRRTLDESVERQGELKLLKHTADIDEKKIIAKYDDADSDASDKDNDDDGWNDSNAPPKNGNESESDLDTDSTDDDSFDDDDEDEEAALQAELAKIRAEREAAKMKEESEKQKEEETRMEEAALLGNPLLNNNNNINSNDPATHLKKKSRWNEDVVFRNQAKNVPIKKEKRFINDTVRNDFHRRFLDKFVR